MLLFNKNFSINTGSKIRMNRPSYSEAEGQTIRCDYVLRMHIVDYSNIN